MDKPSVIAIDGPGGAGKGTLARLLTQALRGWHLLDSGALYRLVALAAAKRGVALQDEAQLAALAAGLEAEFVVTDQGEPRILLDNEEVSDLIRSEAYGNAASQAAALPAVRSALLERQRAFRRVPGLVADGRDMGTVVFPDAEVKIFLTASLEQRALRRYKQLREKGISAILAQLIEEIAKRDERDAKREIAPLRPAVDAHVLDTSGLSISAVKARALAIVKKQLLSQSRL